MPPRQPRDSRARPPPLRALWPPPRRCARRDPRGSGPPLSHVGGRRAGPGSRRTGPKRRGWRAPGRPEDGGGSAGEEPFGDRVGEVFEETVGEQGHGETRDEEPASNGMAVCGRVGSPAGSGATRERITVTRGNAETAIRASRCDAAGAVRYGSAGTVDAHPRPRVSRYPGTKVPKPGCRGRRREDAALRAPVYLGPRSSVHAADGTVYRAAGRTGASGTREGGRRSHVPEMR